MKTKQQQPPSNNPLDMLFGLLSWVIGRGFDLLLSMIQRLVYAMVKPRKPRKEAEKKSLGREPEEERKR